MERPLKRTKRNVICVDGIKIDEGDYNCLKKIYGDDFEIKHAIENCDIKVGGHNRVQRAMRIDLEEAEDMAKYIVQLDCLDYICLILNGGEKLEWIEDLPNLRALCIFGYWDFQKLPSEIQRLCNLEALEIYSQELISIPSWIGDLKSLTKLTIIIGRFQSLPDELGALVNLKELTIVAHELVALPDTFCDLIRLERLCLPCIRLKSLPNEIGRLANLKDLSLGCSAIVSLPDSARNLTKLTDITIPFKMAHGYLSGLSAQLAKLKVIQLVGKDVTITPETFSILQKAKNLKKLLFKSDYKVDQEGNSFRILQHLAQQCPYLGCLGDCFPYKKDDCNSEALANTLLCNRMRSRLFRSPVVPSLWPFILHNADKAAKDASCCNACCKLDNRCTKGLLTQAEAIFNILVSLRSVHAILANRE